MSEERRFGWVDKTQWAILSPWPAPLTGSGQWEVIGWTVTKKEATTTLREWVPNPQHRRHYRIVRRAALEQM